jgi:hypothetical protein
MPLKAMDRASCAADSYMQLAVYDLLGALFAPTDPSRASRHADRLFARIRDVVKDGFADPGFRPASDCAQSRHDQIHGQRQHRALSRRVQNQAWTLAIIELNLLDRYSTHEREMLTRACTTRGAPTMPT